MAKSHPAQKTTDAAPAPKTTTPADLQAELDRLRAENEALKGASGMNRAVSLKISEKGALSAYGMGRFPVTLYREQWEKLLDAKDQILEFITANDANLKRKEVK